VRRRAGQVILVVALVVGSVVYLIANGLDLGIGWKSSAAAVVCSALSALSGVFARRYAERKRRERDELVNSILGRDRYVLPPLDERDELYARVKIAERPVEHVDVPWHRSRRTLMLVPLPAGILGAAFQGSGFWLLLVFVGLVLAVAYLFTRAFEKEVETQGIGSLGEKLS
jgi:membrane protein implicated in regulation of membrane protease activity